MGDPVDLTNLHEMTGDDKALEKELFDVYISSSEACLARLKATVGPGQEEEWRTQAHAWKGMSYNLGAKDLGDLCANAQIDNLAPPEKKADMLTAMESAFAAVKDYLSKL